MKFSNFLSLKLLPLVISFICMVASSTRIVHKSSQVQPLSRVFEEPDGRTVYEFKDQPTRGQKTVHGRRPKTNDWVDFFLHHHPSSPIVGIEIERETKPQTNLSNYGGYGYGIGEVTTTQPPSTPPPPRKPIDLPEMWSDVFNWRKDLANDPRFKNCPPDLSKVSEIAKLSPQKSFFVSLNPRHRMAAMLIQGLITSQDTLQKRICMAGILRGLKGINPHAWLRGVYGAQAANSELFDLDTPEPVVVTPSTFIPAEARAELKRQSALPPGSRTCVPVDGRYGVDNGVENVLWYFREDVGVNQFHMRWHEFYPIKPAPKADRQGELFYFTHHAHLARYHAERLANRLSPVEPLVFTQETVLGEGFNSHLDDTNSAKSWTPRSIGRRVEDTRWDNVLDLPSVIYVANQTILTSRIQEAILSGLLPLPRGALLLDSRTGIDFLGDIVEATNGSANPAWFGEFGFHNEGHVLIGNVEDPRNLTGKGSGVMAEVATAMRDPIFYRHHTNVDNVFNLHKQLLPPYVPVGGELQLIWEVLEIQSVEVAEECGLTPSQPNQLFTFFNQTRLDMNTSLDFQGTDGNGSIEACVTRLDHNPFTYRILVNRHARGNPDLLATVRIFMAPRFNELGQRYRLIEQRKYFFMMDLFQASLKPGLNLITRPSSESSLTVDNNHCNCGWPQHMLLPRGTVEGMAFDLFVMITNAQEDAVALTNPNTNTAGSCSLAPIYCGRREDTYPDSRPMNYPFDRLPFSVNEVLKTPTAGDPTLFTETVTTRPVLDLEEYVSHVPNMASSQIVIRHNPQVRPLPPKANQNQLTSPTCFHPQPALLPAVPTFILVPQTPSLQLSPAAFHLLDGTKPVILG